MVFPWLAVASVANIGSSLFGISEARGAAGDAEQLGRLNATYIRTETGEQMRRLKFEQDRTTGRAKLGIAASGFRSGERSMGGSHRAYLSTLADVQQGELDWLQKSGAQRAEIAKRGGQAAGAELKASTIGMYGQAIGAGANLAYNWQAGTPGYTT